MKKIFVSVGLAAAGAAGMSSAIAQSMEAPAPAKVWNVSGTLRGFYDDNYLVTHHKQGSAGFEVSPSVSANVNLQQTDIGLKYTLGMYFYADRSNKGQNPLDYTHQADFWLDHAFNERVKATAADTLVIAQDPTLVNGGAVTRVGGNNVANRAKLSVDAELAPKFSTSTFYQNSLFVYTDSSNGAGPSEAALLNRMEQRFGVDLQWHLQEETMAFVGYNFRMARYSGNQQIYPTVIVNGQTYNYMSDSRDFNAHYGYVGLQHTFTPSIKGEVRGGATYTDSYNDPAGAVKKWSPYADLNLTYTYVPGSYLQVGFTQDINSTDVVAPSPDGHLTQYQQSSIGYVALNHRITAKITGSLTGQYQYSKYENGQYGSSGDNYVSAGVNLTYHINHNFSANAGYNFSDLNSDVADRGYSRNRVYIGLAANY